MRATFPVMLVPHGWTHRVRQTPTSDSMAQAHDFCIRVICEQVQPRYVIAGGQRASFTLKYSVPLHNDADPSYDVFKKDSSKPEFGKSALVVDMPMG